MKNRFEPTACAVVCESGLPHARPIERAAGLKHGIAKSRTDGWHGRPTGFRQLTRDHVGIDQGNTVRSKAIGNR